LNLVCESQRITADNVKEMKSENLNAQLNMNIEKVKVKVERSLSIGYCLTKALQCKHKMKT